MYVATYVPANVMTIDACVCVRACVRVCVCLSVCTCMRCVSMRVCVYLCVRVCIHMYMRSYVGTYVCCTHTQVCMMLNTDYFNTYTVQAHYTL